MKREIGSIIRPFRRFFCIHEWVYYPHPEYDSELWEEFKKESPTESAWVENADTVGACQCEKCGMTIDVRREFQLG